MTTEVNAYAIAYQNMKDNLGFTNEDVLTYAWIDMVNSHNSNKIIVNIEKPQLLGV